MVRLSRFLNNEVKPQPDRLSGLTLLVPAR